MHLLTRLFQPVRAIGTRLSAPFQSVLYSVRGFRPLSGARIFFQGISSRMGYITRLPEQLLGIKMPGAKLPGAKAAGGFHPREAVRDWWASLPGRGGAESRRVKVAKRAQFSQIHLVNLTDNARTVLHIGTIIGRSQSDITLEHTAHQPAYLRFTQVDPAEHGAPMLLSYVAGEVVVEVDGVRVEHDALIQKNSLLKIAGQDYGCELYAWDKTPVVTRVDAGWATTVGPVRDINEDAIGIYQHEKAYLFAIADGVGGGEDGDLLSEFAIQYLLAVFHKNVAFNLRWRDIFAKAFLHINAEARYFSRRSPYPAGTTLTAVVIKNFEAHVAHVGDSRLYLLHNGLMRQMTADHSKRVEVEMETRHANQSTEPPPMRDVLMKAVGKSDLIEPDVFSITLQPGDRLLLCTDGLTNVVPLEDIARIVNTTRAEPAARLLIQSAVERKASDNVSAVMIDVMTDPYLEDIWSSRGSERVYAGYDRAWLLKLKKPGEPVTEHPEAKRAGCAAILVGIVLVAVFLIWSGRGGSANAIAAGVETQTPSATLTLAPIIGMTMTDPRPSMTPSPTATRTITPAPILTSTPLPTLTAVPTVELKPTSTLRPPSV